MNEYLATSIGGKTEALNTQRAVKLETGSRLFLLKRNEYRQNEFVSEEILTGWMARPTDYRNEFEFEIAPPNSAFRDKISQFSFLGFGVPDADGEIDVYRIDPEQRDETPETGFRASWKNIGVRADNERFVIPG